LNYNQAKLNLYALDCASSRLDLFSSNDILPFMITPHQIRAARALLDLTQADLAERASLSKTGLNNIERGTSDPKASTLAAIQSALETAGVEFIPENGGGPGVRLRKGSR
jgi:DNA-binding XRE family transcriptional regulator